MINQVLVMFMGLMSLFAHAQNSTSEVDRKRLELCRVALKNETKGAGGQCENSTHKIDFYGSYGGGAADTRATFTTKQYIEKNRDIQKALRDIRSQITELRSVAAQPGAPQVERQKWITAADVLEFNLLPEVECWASNGGIQVKKRPDACFGISDADLTAVPQHTLNVRERDRKLVGDSTSGFASGDGKTLPDSTFKKMDPNENHEGKQCSYFTKPAVTNDGGRLNYYGQGAYVVYGKWMYQCTFGRWKNMGPASIWSKSDVDRLQAENIEKTQVKQSDAYFEKE